MSKTIRLPLLLLASAAIAVFSSDVLAVPAFPGAEGFGAQATGGRGGRVIEVTNLDDDGPGSLREAVKANGPRTIVFRVSGNVELQSPLEIRNGDLTIAGQTAPAGGICIKNCETNMTGAENIIIRYLRFRPGDLLGEEPDALTGLHCRKFIIDHCSVSWGIDECLTFYHAKDFTVQWCVIGESLYDSVHFKGPHGYGGIWGGNNGSWHHNLLAHHSSRNPRFAQGDDNVDYRNNVVYNWGFNSAYGGEQGTSNMVNNYYKPGPATRRDCRTRILDGRGEGGRWYLAGNVIDGNPVISSDNWNGGVHRPYTEIKKMRAEGPFPAAPVTTHTAEQAYELVLRDAGATLPARDSWDTRIVAETRAGTASFGGRFRGEGTGIIDSQDTVGGWPELDSIAPPDDGDHDGMPDEWEQRFGFSPSDASDGPQDADGDGYTNLEELLNATNPLRPESPTP